MKVFNNKEVLKIINKFPEVLEGERNNKNGLWEVKLYTTRKKQQINFISNFDVKIKEKVTLLYRALYSPNKKSLIRSVKEDLLINWPTLSEKNIQENISNLDIHYKRGHMLQTPQGSKSTRNTQSLYSQK